MFVHAHASSASTPSGIPTRPKCAGVLEAVKDKPCGWRYAPSLTASARAGSYSIVGRDEETSSRANKVWRDEKMDRTLGAPP